MVVELDWPNWPGFSSRAQAELEAYPWPGNVRELRNTVERMAILSPTDLIGMDGVPVEIREREDGRPKSSVRETRESAERDFIRRTLEDCGWNVSSAARALGMERTNLHKRIRALGLVRSRAN